MATEDRFEQMRLQTVCRSLYSYEEPTTFNKQFVPLCTKHALLEASRMFLASLHHGKDRLLNRLLEALHTMKMETWSPEWIPSRQQWRSRRRMRLPLGTGLEYDWQIAAAPCYVLLQVHPQPEFLISAAWKTQELHTLTPCCQVVRRCRSLQDWYSLSWHCQELTCIAQRITLSERINWD